MSQAAQQLIRSYESLPEPDKREVLVHLLRRPVEDGYSAPSDDDLCAIADQIFVDLDQRETK